MTFCSPSRALTCVVGGTKTGVVVDSIDAGCSVLAVVVLAVVDVGLASGALKAQRTRATVKTSRHVKLLMLSSPARPPLHSSPSSPVHPLLVFIHPAGSSVGAWVTHAGVQSCLAVLTLRHGTDMIVCCTIIPAGALKWVFTWCRSHLESWRTAAPVDVHHVAVTDALVQTRAGQAGVALSQHCSVHITCRKATQTRLKSM